MSSSLNGQTIQNIKTETTIEKKQKNNVYDSLFENYYFDGNILPIIFGYAYTDTFPLKPQMIIGTGKESKENGEFNHPCGIVYDNRNKRILVSESGNSRIQVFNTQGKYINQFGSRGSENGKFKYPKQLCLHPVSNNIIIADYGNHRIQMFNGQFQFVACIGEEVLHRPYAVDCSSVSSYPIVTADFDYQNYLFTPSNNNEYRRLRSFCSTGGKINQTGGVCDICFDDEHKQILICDYNNMRISVWSMDGSQFLGVVNMPNKQEPYSVCMDKYNNNNNNSHHFIVGTYTQILVFDVRNNNKINYNCIQTIGSKEKGSEAGEFNGVRGVCIDMYGCLWTSDYDNHRIQMF